jgi:hypothetical protein
MDQAIARSEQVRIGWKIGGQWLYIEADRVEMRQREDRGPKRLFVDERDGGRDREVGGGGRGRAEE